MRGTLEVAVSFFRFRSDFVAFFARISHFKFKEFNKTIMPLYALGSALALYMLLASIRIFFFTSSKYSSFTFELL